MNNLKFKLTFLLLVVLFKSGSVLAQGKSHHPNQKFYIGAEGTLGTRAFNIKSDVSAINHTNAFLSGQGFGIMTGNKTFHLKLRRAYFKTEPIEQKLKLIENEGVINLYPLQMIKSKFRFFEPYLLAGINRSNLKFFGDYIPASTKAKASTKPDNKANPSSGNTGGSCTCGSPPLPVNPEQPLGVPSTSPAQYSTLRNPAALENTPNSYLGAIVITRATIGFGLECHVPGTNHFINLFAEAKYGFPIAITSSNSSFENTRVSPQLAINAGLNFGLNR